MKKLAFFIALFIGLNATSIVRRPEEEEGLSVIQQDKLPSEKNQYIHVIQVFTHKLSVYFYALTREGIFHRISWERISEIINKQQENKKITRIVYRFESKGKNNCMQIEKL